MLEGWLVGGWRWVVPVVEAREAWPADLRGEWLRLWVKLLLLLPLELGSRRLLRLPVVLLMDWRHERMRSEEWLLDLERESRRERLLCFVATEFVRPSIFLENALSLLRRRLW